MFRLQGTTIEDSIPWSIESELDTLKVIARCCDDVDESARNTALDKVPAPYLLEYHIEDQPENSWLTNGFLVYIVMRHKKGARLTKDEFWAMKRRQRDEMRTAFMNSYNEMLYLKICHGDQAIRNLLWDLDSTPVQCNIVDFEGANMLEESVKRDAKLSKWTYLPWGLAEN